jgi:hypothetical protein
MDPINLFRRAGKATKDLSMNVLSLTVLFAVLRAGLAFPAAPHLEIVALRDLGDIIGGFYPPSTTAQVATGNSEYHDAIRSALPGGNAEGGISRTKLSASATSMSTEPHSMINSSATDNRASLSATFSQTTLTAKQTLRTEADAAAATTPSAAIDAVTSHWKLVGISVIVVSTVATMILSIVFFDQWTRFLKGMLWRSNRDAGSEDLLPDWEKRSWHYHADEHGIRYPTTAKSTNSTRRAKEAEADPEDEDCRNPFPRRPQPALTPAMFSITSPDANLPKQPNGLIADHIVNGPAR